MDRQERVAAERARAEARSEWIPPAVKERVSDVVSEVANRVEEALLEDDA